MSKDFATSGLFDEAVAKTARRICPTKFLSEREQEILKLAARGLVDKEISAQTGLAYTTVKSYWARILSKMEVRSRPLAIATLLRAALNRSLELAGQAANEDR